MTGGNAFFVTEAIAAGGDAPPPSRAGRGAGASGAARTRRAATLDLVAVVPGAAELWLVREAQEDARRRSPSCEERGLLPVDGGVVRFRHELARRVIEDALSGGRRAELHARVLDGARCAGTSIRPGSCTTPSRRATRARPSSLACAPAAAAAGSRAHAEAAAHYARVLAHASCSTRRSARRALEALAGESYHGRPGRGRARRPAARPSACAARPATPCGWATTCACWRGCSGGRSGDDERRAQRALEEAIAVLEPLGATPGLAMAYSERAQLLMLEQRDAEAVAAGERAIELARELDDDAALRARADDRRARRAAPIADEVEAGPSVSRRRSPSASASATTSRSAGPRSRGLDGGRLARGSTGRGRPATACSRWPTRASSGRSGSTGWRPAPGSTSRSADWDAAAADAEEVLAQAEGPPVARMPALGRLATRRHAPRRARARRPCSRRLRPWRSASGELQRLGPSPARWPSSRGCATTSRRSTRSRGSRTRSPCGSATTGTSATSPSGAGGPVRSTSAAGLRRAAAAPDRGRAARRPPRLARDRRPLPGRALRSPTATTPTRSLEAVAHRRRAGCRGARPPGAARACARSACQRAARAAAVDPREPGRAHGAGSSRCSPCSAPAPRTPRSRASCS